MWKQLKKKSGAALKLSAKKCMQLVTCKAGLSADDNKFVEDNYDGFSDRKSDAEPQLQTTEEEFDEAGADLDFEVEWEEPKNSDDDLIDEETEEIIGTSLKRSRMRANPEAGLSFAENMIIDLLKRWERLLNSKAVLFANVRVEINCLFEELQLLRNFLEESEKKLLEHENLKNLVMMVVNMAYEADSIINKFINEYDGRVYRYEARVYNHQLHPIIANMEFIRTGMVQNYKKLLGTAFLQVEGDFVGNVSKIGEDSVVGFDSEAATIIERLTGYRKELDIISIVGMAGIGKTTLAKKVYNDPYVEYHFYIRGWINVSQTYTERDLLVGILYSAFQFKDDVYGMGNEKLRHELYKRLKGKKYLIVMDDIWDIEAWNVLRRCFPDDKNGSRILFTSRLKDVAMSAKPDSPPHYIRFLTQDESWNLLQWKVFGTGCCPRELVEYGKQIAEKCHGLPLAIVVVAGLLAKTDKAPYWWGHVNESVSPYSDGDADHKCVDAIALSYKHLPDHLKACFLYLGVFPEDFEIPVRKLTWLWVAEGLTKRISQNTAEDKSEEEIAEDYLMNLFDRSLVLVGNRRFDGRIKTCHLHDVLRDFCMKKAKEENFLLQIEKCGQSSSSSPIAYDALRLSIHSRAFDYIASNSLIPHIQSFFCLASEMDILPRDNTSFVCHTFKLLKVLDMSSIQSICFPSEIVELIHLTFLALRAEDGCPPISIYKLKNLESLVILSRKNINIPQCIWTMIRLRHLYVKTGENNLEGPCFVEAADSQGYPNVLDNLQTISQVCPSKACMDVLLRTPNVRKLGLCGLFVSESGKFWFPCLDFLYKLEALKLVDTNCDLSSSCNLQLVTFPPSLRRLTLSHTQLDWGVMSIIGKLPNLESLKLESHACVGKVWRTFDGGFCRLKLLKLSFIDIHIWEASSSHFPTLERLVLYGCKQLLEIPSDLGNIATLQMIEVTWCSFGAEDSAQKIEEEQQSLDNDELKIVIHPSFEERKEKMVTRKGDEIYWRQRLIRRLGKHYKEERKGQI